MNKKRVRETIFNLVDHWCSEEPIYRANLPWIDLKIFEDIENPQYTDQEKLTAIHMVLERETHNCITKQSILKAMKWLFDCKYIVG